MARRDERVLDIPGPCRITLQKGRRYLWCACGRSRREPLCDSSHEGSGVEPVEFRTPENLTVALCGCKLTRKPPYCDGSHLHGFRDSDGRIVRKEEGAGSGPAR